MKFFLSLLLAIAPICALGAPTTNTKAGIAQVVTSYASTNVGTSTPVQILASVPATGASMIDIFDSSGQTLQLTYKLNGASTVVANIYPGGNGQLQVFIPGGAALLLKSLTTTVSSGTDIINIFY